MPILLLDKPNSPPYLIILLIIYLHPIVMNTVWKYSAGILLTAVAVMLVASVAEHPYPANAASGPIFTLEQSLRTATNQGQNIVIHLAVTNTTNNAVTAGYLAMFTPPNTTLVSTTSASQFFHPMTDG